MPASTRGGANHRRVTIKVRVVQVGQEWGREAAVHHARYLEREGVERDGTPGKLYGAEGSMERRELTQELPGERHQFRIVVSPEDGHEVDLKTLVRDAMAQFQEDLGRELLWGAVNHYNTDDPHAHVVIRGVDARGEEVWIDRAYISHGMRRRAEDLVTERLGPRPEQSRVEQLKRDAALERYTSLDREVERRSVRGVFRAERKGHDVHLEAALRTRVDVLEGLGLAQPVGYRQWRLHPELRSRLQSMARRAEGLRAIRAVVRVRRSVVIDRVEPNVTDPDLDRGLQGIVRWKGLDDAGHFVAVVETTAGAAYYTPLTARACARIGVGQIVALERARDKDAEIAEVAAKAEWKIDLGAADEELRAAFRPRLEQLERMRLAKRLRNDHWQLRPDFREQIAGGKPPPYWQRLSVREQQQRLHEQVRYVGHVWLDRVSDADLAAVGFGADVRRAREARHDYLRALGLDPASKNLRWELQDLQRHELEATLAQSTGRVPLEARSGFSGIAHVHEMANGQRFLEVRSETHFVIRGVRRDDAERLAAAEVRFEADLDGKLRLVPASDAERLRTSRHVAALRQIAAVMPMVPDQCRVVEPDRFSETDRRELDGGVVGIVRWVKSDDHGRPQRAIVEAVNGRIYHLPVPPYHGKSKAFQPGRVVELRPAIGMDARIEASARANGNVHDLAKLPERERPWHQRRLAELERMRLAKPLGGYRWQLEEGFVARSQPQHRQPVDIQIVSQPIADQVQYPGPVWLDRLRTDELGGGGFAGDLRAAALKRQEYLRGQGLDPEAEPRSLNGLLLKLQRKELQAALVARGGQPAQTFVGVEGTARVHREANGQRFVEVQSPSGQFALVSAPRETSSLDGQTVRIALGADRRVRLEVLQRARGRVP